LAGCCWRGAYSHSIAGGREQECSKACNLPHFHRWQIAWGKLASALLFALLLWSCALPIGAVCFMLGGVSIDSM
jgi:hypothetical protein